jgi:iron complex outermembrane recepter protein
METAGSVSVLGRTLIRKLSLYLIAGGVVVLQPAAIRAAAVKNSCQLQGLVRTAQGTSIAGASVTLVETGTTVLTDFDGSFNLLTQTCALSHLKVAASGYFQQSFEVLPSSGEVDVVLARTVLVKEEVSVTASRMEIPLSENPAATSIVTAETLDAMPRAVGAEEALISVPGVKVDNQANQERVHISIRGQGILSEHGVRGIQVLLDGLPLSDPSGFVPDLYDVDWGNVEEVAVVRGPVASLYGGGSSGGVIDIVTHTASQTPHASFSGLGGSNEFYKGHADYSQKLGEKALLLSAARAASAGYRVHTDFYGDNLSGKLSMKARPDLLVNFIGLGTAYFNQNPEGLSLEQVQQDPRQPNPDALTYNEYMKTKRGTGGLTGGWTPTEHQRLSFTAIGRYTHYDESVPSSVDHQDIGAAGGSAQYDVELKMFGAIHHLSSGFDIDGQATGDYRHPNAGGGNQTSEFLADQNITEKRAAGFVADRVELGSKWTLLANARWDHIGDEVADKLKLNGLDLSGKRTFNRATGRIGVTFNPRQDIGLFASWGQGYIPPATEELYANPDALGGFNLHLKPATSWGVDAGIHGTVRTAFYYEVEVFRLNTANDFERYRIKSRPLETFYGNAGNTSRNGLEAEFRWMALRRVTVTGAYTYSHFTYEKYASSVYAGDLIGNWLPNSPNHQIYVQAAFQLPRSLTASIGTQALSRAFIDPTNAAFIDGYGLLNARFAKVSRCGRFTCELSLAGRNLAATKYIAFTEPDPDGNSYQPGPRREVFGGVILRF